MAVVVQSKATSNGGSSMATSFNSLPSATNSVLVIGGCTDDTTVSTVADNQSGNTYSQVIIEQQFGGGHAFAFAYWCQSITTPSGTFTVTMTPTNGPAGGTAGIMLLEVSGIASVDQTGGANNGNNTGTSLTVTASGQNVYANELAVYAIVARSTGDSTSFASGATSGWTSPMVFSGNFGGCPCIGGYKILSAVETTQAVSPTWTSGSGCAGVVVTFVSAFPPFGGGICVTA